MLVDIAFPRAQCSSQDNHRLCPVDVVASVYNQWRAADEVRETSNGRKKYSGNLEISVAFESSVLRTQSGSFVHATRKITYLWAFTTCVNMNCAIAWVPVHLNDEL